jgi:hypothetical protein
VTAGFGSVCCVPRRPLGGTRLDAGDGTRRAYIESGVALGIAIGEGSVWVTNAGDGTVSRIDRRRGVTGGSRGAPAAGITVGDGASGWQMVWAPRCSSIRVGPVGRGGLDGQPSSVIFTEDMWVAALRGGARRPRTPQIAPQAVGTGLALVRAFGSIWIANDVDGCRAARSVDGNEQIPSATDRRRSWPPVDACGRDR